MEFLEENRDREPVIELRNADISNSHSTILWDVSMKIYPGEFVYLIGKVGSGKSSIINTLIGEYPLVKGRGYIGRYNLTRLKNRQIPYLRRSVGVVFQDFKLLMDRNVYENLAFVLKATGISRRSVINDKIESVLSSVRMLKKAYLMPHQLSGGEQQRIAIARALLNEPDIILADEPTGNLDVETTEELMNLFQEINRKQDAAILMVTHNQQIFKQFPGRVFVCENQTVREIEDETPVMMEDIYDLI